MAKMDTTDHPPYRQKLSINKFSSGNFMSDAGEKDTSSSDSITIEKKKSTSFDRENQSYFNTGNKPTACVFVL